VTLPNREGVLMPGAYVQVALPLEKSAGMTVSTNALMIRGEGTQVASVDEHGIVHLKPVKVGRNYGQSVELLEGVTPKDRLVLNPPDSMAEGDKVAIAPTEKKPAAAKADGAQNRGAKADVAARDRSAKEKAAD
jgi:hypothetical protein